MGRAANHPVRRDLVVSAARGASWATSRAIRAVATPQRPEPDRHHRPPCHRVVGSNGALTGYAGGLGRKAVPAGSGEPGRRGNPGWTVLTRIEPHVPAHRSVYPVWD
ncbi:hypothetical protein GS421_05785 [Rhodococcus hoagii]|nr:hypothetical protein [Prescottella equi]